MAKPIIAVDVDDVLAANAEGFIAYSNERWGTNLTVNDYQEHWSEMWGLDHDETDRRAVEFHLSNTMSRYGHYPEAIEVLRHLSKNYDLIVVTSRRISVMEETLEWLGRYFPELFKGIYFAGIYDDTRDNSVFSKTKLDTVQAQGADYLIDDQLKHCEAVAAAGVQAILFGEYPWNKANLLPENVARCKDWQAVREYFDGR